MGSGYEEADIALDSLFQSRLQEQHEVLSLSLLLLSFAHSVLEKKGILPESAEIGFDSRATRGCAWESSKTRHGGALSF